MTTAAYQHMTRTELQSLRRRFIAVLAGQVGPRCANREQVEGYLAAVEAALQIVAARELATAPSIAEMRNGTRAPRNDADRERQAWSYWS